MYALYETLKNDFEIHHRKSTHMPPHIHNSMECILITEGTLELGIAQNLFHMEKGDFAIVFPDMIHHYQVFDTGKCTAIHMLATPVLAGSFLNAVLQSCPDDPVIPKDRVHPDIAYILKSLVKEEGQTSDVLQQAFVQIILARALPQYKLVDKRSTESKDIIDRTVEYIARHFTEDISLTSMAEDLYVSQYTLSRVFSGTFHTNFNKYLNNTRLQYAVYLLKYTNESITDAYMDAGFESQRTFNRAFQETYRMSPREYRKLAKQELLEMGEDQEPVPEFKLNNGK